MPRPWLRTAVFLAGPLLAGEARAQHDLTHEPLPIGDLRELLEAEVTTDLGGSFGSRLRRYGVVPYTHGQVGIEMSGEWEPDEQATLSFALRDFSLYFGAEIQGRVIPELSLEVHPEFHEGAAHIGIDATYAQVDVRLIDSALVARAGYFLVPFGKYNAQYYPRFINKLPSEPTFVGLVVPQAWREVGLQLHGELEIAPERSFSYALFLANGLEEPLTEEAEPRGPAGAGELTTVFEGVGWAPSIGARLAIEPLATLTLGLSGYTTAYGEDAERRLSAIGADAGLYAGRLTIEAEAALSAQDVGGAEVVVRSGVFALVGYRVTPSFEPLVAVDLARTSEAHGEQSYMAGVAIYPWADTIPTAIVKVFYDVDLDLGGELEEQEVELQFALGF